MKVYLASPGVALTYAGPECINGRYVLETYEVLRKVKKDIDWIGRCGSFLLDSGAYTFMRGTVNPVGIDWEKYIHEYALFIKRYNIKYFFELDIDKIVGYDNVLKLTSALNKKTGLQCLPVWHKSRGLEEWHRLTREYKYVSLSASGNNGSSEWTRKPEGEGVMYQLNKIALQNGSKVHALGFTKIPVLRRIPFYSVDSTAWLRGIYGNVMQFTPQTEGAFTKTYKKPGQRMKTKEIQNYNWQQWVNFQQWAETNL